MNEFELMQTAVRNCRRMDLYLDPPPLTAEQNEQLIRMRARRQSGEPLQYILGHTEFMGLTLSVTPDVLIPRPETEIMVDTVIQLVQKEVRGTLSVLDIGTGSGNIAIALACFLPQCQVVSLDISSAAQQVARRNAIQNDVSSRINFQCQDVNEFLNSVNQTHQRFDIIISNPPYIETRKLPTLPAEVQREPIIALDGGEDGLIFLRSILKSGWDILAPEGILALEIGDGQRPTVERIVRELAGMASCHFVADYVGTDRIVIVRKEKT